MSNTISVIPHKRDIIRVKIQDFVPQLSPISLSAALTAAIPKGRGLDLMSYRITNVSDEIFVLRFYFQYLSNINDNLDIGVPARYVVPQPPNGISLLRSVPNIDPNPLDFRLDAYSDTDLTVKFAGVIVDGQVNIDIDFITT